MKPSALVVATLSQLELLLPLVRSFHQFEKIEMTDDARAASVTPLLGNSSLGRVWLMQPADVVVGYVAICYGYSIEFQGRDAFIDEFFLIESARGQGIGREALDVVRSAASDMGIVALHLEVARSNTRARRFYETLGFTARDRYHLMTCPLVLPGGKPG
ncbi:MAG TPA: GNAT family N-acetyltransferase [Woeseiaceae bacterium]